MTFANIGTLGTKAGAQEAMQPHLTPQREALRDLARHQRTRLA